MGSYADVGNMAAGGVSIGLAIFILVVCAIIYVIPMILCIILFFKMWGMVNDVKVIKERLTSRFPDKEGTSGEPTNGEGQKTQ